MFQGWQFNIKRILRPRFWPPSTAFVEPAQKNRLRHGFWWTNPLCFFLIFFQVMVNWWFGFLLDPLMKGIDCYIGAPRFESQTSGPQTTPTRGDQKKHFDLWIEAFAKRILLQILGFCTLKSFKILFSFTSKIGKISILTTISQRVGSTTWYMFFWFAWTGLILW